MTDCTHGYSYQLMAQICVHSGHYLTTEVSMQIVVMEGEHCTGLICLSYGSDSYYTCMHCKNCMVSHCNLTWVICAMLASSHMRASQHNADISARNHQILSATLATGLMTIFIVLISNRNIVLYTQCIILSVN